MTSRFVREPRPRRRVRATETGDSLRLEYVWLEGWAVVAAAIAAPVMIYYGIDTIAESVGSLPVLRKLLGGFITLVGTAVGYFGLATLLNRTLITITEGRLTVRHGPLPWPGNRDVDVDDIQQLYCTVYHGGRYDRLRWRLQAVTGLVGSVTLLDHIRSKSEAVSLELSIERHLGIPDWPRYGD